jgi:predicted kinase
VSSTVQGGQWLVVVTGWTGAGKSTIADAMANELRATVASFDWVMSALRCHEDVWSAVEEPVELQRRIGWDLLSRIVEQQLRGGRSCILDLVAREQPRQEWAALADRYSASFAVVECVCSDVEVHRRRVDGRRREIPGWYELKWEWVERGRQLYEPLSEPKVVIDAIEPLEHNLGVVMHHLSTERVHARESTRSRPDLASTPTHITVGADQQ